MINERSSALSVSPEGKLIALAHGKKMLTIIEFDEELQRYKKKFGQNYCFDYCEWTHVLVIMDVDSKLKFYDINRCCEI